MSELRKDPIVGRWIIISKSRGKRPHDYSSGPKGPIKPGPCNFCTGHESVTGGEVLAFRDSGQANESNWRVRVVPNLYPAVSSDVEYTHIDSEKDACEACSSGAGPVFEGCKMPAFGSHEVVVETPNHDQSQFAYSEEQLTDVMRAYKQRVFHYRSDPRYQCVQIFKNHGNAAGASMAHSHSQLIALPVAPQRCSEEISGAEGYYNRAGQRCVFCDVVEHELEEKEHRLVAENEAFIAVQPFAPRFPYETWLIPKRHCSNFECALDDELKGAASILLLLLRKFEQVFDSPPYNYTIHSSPLQKPFVDVKYYHWHIRVIPHLVEMGGFELGSGCHLNSVSPEAAAEHLRGVHVAPTGKPKEDRK